MNPSSGVAGGYQLVCPNPTAHQLLQTWLEEARLPWPGRIRLEVNVVPELPASADSRETFSQPSVAIQAGPPDGTVRIEWASAPARAIVHPTAPGAELWLTPEALEKLEAAERSFLLVTLLFVLRRLGWYHVHGAALTDPSGAGWMLVGNSGTGKSTTTALLASRGWTVSTDDIGFLVPRDGVVDVIGFRSPIALRAGAVDRLGRSGGLDLARRRKHGFWPEDLGGTWTSRVEPRYLLFPTLGEVTRATPLGAAQSISELVKWSIWILFEPLHAQEHLDALGRLVGQARCFETTFGPDLFADPTLLPKAVHAALSSAS